MSSDADPSPSSYYWPFRLSSYLLSSCFIPAYLFVGLIICSILIYDTLPRGLSLDMRRGLAAIAALSTIAICSWMYSIIAAQKTIEIISLIGFLSLLLLLFFPVLIVIYVTLEITRQDQFTNYLDFLIQNSSVYLVEEHWYIPIIALVTFCVLTLLQYVRLTKGSRPMEIVSASLAFLILPIGVFYLQPKLKKFTDLASQSTLISHLVK